MRTPGEFATGHLPGAVNIPLDRLEAGLADLRQAAGRRPLLLVCASGARSGRAAVILASRGIGATSLAGGTRGWSSAGHPLAHPPGPVRSVWAMERQVRFTAGSVVLLGLLLGLSASIAGGLVFSALTDTCGLAVVLGRLPWNRRGRGDVRPR
ncbi:rhodanese-like domain-containing protein [Streptomyces sp. NPDC048018]|uniref:rhodanese-like domain-containing protein n=1 Tax=Streptomyces sp. NPDC048018 TaxID=3365499 RepID=UPI00371A808A